MPTPSDSESPTRDREACIRNTPAGFQQPGFRVPDMESDGEGGSGDPAAEHMEMLQLAVSQRDTITAMESGIRDCDNSETSPSISPAIDVDSPHFNLRTWVKTVMTFLDNNGVQTKRSGFLMKHVTVSGVGAAVQTQSDITSALLSPITAFARAFRTREAKTILHDINATVRSGQLLLVLGRPGSGCSTLLKTFAGQMHGLHLDAGADISYNGIPRTQMLKEFRGEVVYNQEVDKHFPHLTVGQTLEHTAALRTPRRGLNNTSRHDAVELITKVAMAVYGLSHTYNTKVGNDFVRGVSGGERKRVSIAEMGLSGSPLAAWDNSTRGLDSATALDFVQSLRTAADLVGSTHLVAIYQASQAIYDLFDQVTVLYQGRQIFFGPIRRAKDYFTEMGWHCPPRQTTGDFLTGITNPEERVARDGFESQVPRTAEEFEAHWRKSSDFAALAHQMQTFEDEFTPQASAQIEALRQSKSRQQSRLSNPRSSYVASVPHQVKCNVVRAYQRLWNDKASTIMNIVGNVAMALIFGSVFYGTPDATAGFFAKGSALFFAVLLNALNAMAEVTTLYAQRPIVEKHKSYALYRPASEAVAGIVADIPVKFVMATSFNIVLYFLAGLRREPAQFFLYFLVNFITMFVMSAVFRTMAALTKTVAQALALSGVLVLALSVYTGFVVPLPYMHPWFSWIRFINPVYYAFEILLANEFHGRNFPCSEIIPPPQLAQGQSFICSVPGAVAGLRFVSGDAFIASAYGYTYQNVWRNTGILFVFLIGFVTLYLIATEVNSSSTSTAEFLVFHRSKLSKHAESTFTGNCCSEIARSEKPDYHTLGRASNTGRSDIEEPITPENQSFSWKNVTYDVKIKDETRRLLDNVSGWIKPGTLTALMGTSGAGKTTLLNALALRTDSGVIGGKLFVDGVPVDPSYQRQTGYVQQQDLHLPTATVRESLRFSAMLRQPSSVNKEEKYRHVEGVLRMLNMEDFADAIVGAPGEGLNVEQRKLLTIGVELAAKPRLLLFLDEPTSGLDSQSAWAICSLLRRLANDGQAILCTIHQPSAVLFEQFDRLLFLRKGGRTVYFGDVGSNSHVLLEYFTKHGGRPCRVEENPAEYILEMVTDTNRDWASTWAESQEARDLAATVDAMERENALSKVAFDRSKSERHVGDESEFASSLSMQLSQVTRRIFQQYWRTPSYVLAKIALGLVAGLFIGFSFFRADNSVQGMQNVVFSVFMVANIFTTLVQQIMSLFVGQRALYEVRERPSKTYSWKVFMAASIVVEIPYQVITGILVFVCFYYPVVGIQSWEQQILVLLFIITFFLFASTFAHLLVAGMADAQSAGGIATLLFALTLMFNGVMQPPDALPGFWIFMYRLSPLTYWIGGITTTMLHERRVECVGQQASIFNPPPGMTCGEYLQPFFAQGAFGTLQNPTAASDCRYCALTSADQFLAGSRIFWADRWRNFGLMWVYIFFNITFAIVLYYYVRARKKKEAPKKQKADGRIWGLAKLFFTQRANQETETGRRARKMVTRGEPS